MTTQSPDVEILLIPETPKPKAPSAAALTNSTSVPARCLHRFANGKRCRQSASESHAGLCEHHFRLSNPVIAFPSSPSDSTDLSADLLPEPTDFSYGEDVQKFLARLVFQVTKGRVSPRRATALGFLTNQLLHSHRAIDKESDNEHETIIFDLPRPKRD
jgi:hypothetical protein